MQSHRFSIRRLAALALIALVASGTAACSDDEDEDDEPSIGQITLQIGSVTINSIGGNPPSTPVVIPRGNHAVTVTTRASNGQTITLSPSEFELRITSTNNAVASYSKATAFGGTLNAAAAGSATLNVQLFHLVENHPDYEIRTLPITVQ